MTTNPNQPPIKASELADYGFCHRAWWLQHLRQITPQGQAHLSHGRVAHIRHQQQVRVAGRWRGTGFLLLALGIVVFLAALWQMVG